MKNLRAVLYVTILAVFIFAALVGVWHGPVPPPDEDTFNSAALHGPVPPPDEDTAAANFTPVLHYLTA